MKDIKFELEIIDILDLRDTLCRLYRLIKDNDIEQMKISIDADKDEAAIIFYDRCVMSRTARFDLDSDHFEIERKIKDAIRMLKEDYKHGITTKNEG